MYGDVAGGLNNDNGLRLDHELHLLLHTVPVQGAAPVSWVKDWISSQGTNAHRKSC